MRRLIIHAGFPKCGSTTIFEGLRRNTENLLSRNIFLLDQDLSLHNTSSILTSPLWMFNKAESDQNEANKIRTKAEESLLKIPNRGTGIISAENLAHKNLSGIFEGFDNKFYVHYITYIRPQGLWIPSAWKQWDIKEGLNIPQTIARSIKANRPDYLEFAKNIKQNLPRARVDIRVFRKEFLHGRSLTTDFFHTAGIDTSGLSTEESVENPSMDYSLLFAMMKNSSQLFAGRHDNRFIRLLTQVLPKEYVKVNAALLDSSEQDQIYTHFFSSNRELIRNHAMPHEKNADDLVRQIFHIKVDGPKIHDFAEKEILGRALSILEQCNPTKEGDNPAKDLSDMISESLR